VGQVPPPQSTPVSLPFSTPSLHVAFWQTPPVQTPVVQSPPMRQPSPGPQSGQVPPPQSTSVSAPLSTPSMQVGA
jgi:hypothetical protein